MALYSKLRGILLLPILLFLFSGCKKADKTSQYTIGFSQCIGSDLWRSNMLDEMKMELSLHPDAKFIYADANGNSKKQVEQVKKMLDDGVDLLIISPNEAQPLTDIVEQTYNKGIPVIVIDRKTSSELYTAYVGADNYQLGKMAGEYIGNALQGKGNIVEVMGLPGSSPAIERQRGFSNALAKFNNIHITAQVYGDWLKDNAQKQLTLIQPALKNASAVFAHNDVMALGSRGVLNKLHIQHHVKVLGVDALPGSGGGLQMVSSKTIDASLLYPTGGKEAIMTAFRILNKEPFSKENILQSLVIDSTNVQLMKLQWNKINSQQKDIERQQSLLAEQREIYNSQQMILNIIVITLVLAIVFGGLAFYSLMENRKINKSLEAKNNEILLQRNQLLEMSARAEAATEAKLNFFTNISHEFRTPLTLILSPVEDMMRNEKLNIVAGKSLKLIHKNVFRLLRLVNQLIDYRKIEYDKQQINASPNNVVAFVRDILDSFQHNAQKRNISLSLISTEPNITVWFDVNMLDKVFFNLISNSLKFTKDNGRIQVSFTKNENTIDIAIQDSGIGMEPAEAEHVFNQFYQADNGNAKGSGLGLSLSKEIITIHQGSISVSSKKWQGTTFIITLPLGNQHINNTDVQQIPSQPLAISERALIYTTDLEQTEINDNADSLATPKEQSILIIEDNTDLLNYLTEKLSTDYEIFTADNGTQGLTEAFEKVPDLILSDVVLPGISGKVITENIKTDIRTSHIPVILLTAQASVEQQIDGIHSMADVYMVKPFNYDHLLATVKNLIKNRVILKEHFTSDVSHGKMPVSKTLDKKFLNDFAGIVEQNLANESFNVEDICKTIGISRVQLYRKVKALLGCSITDYILNRRLKKAKYLLINEAYSIAEITYQVGFSTPNYFSTVFKAKYGCTPSEFKRKQHS
ncbi:substrate-binding domain-containing protein [Mucilaginibacter sp. SP1R1]|uniref:hybrid sensor histidine kinase/response regulator transcription factor n=1 Tax=Mucilaginibacter sp. SP1R1 TaxID=2723091 RepID=UPI0016130B94|nr:substrate-binding domain-containing protein [Mucilaginibacter sp. SP1R1]MBB6149102.1 signal transduction histidine kinase/AraC-like DNA-binding protein/ABC-type xylose transport system substrate-binding protein [Mucilaginibacter sp. SP1R1]